MDEHPGNGHRPSLGRRRRWFVAIDPIWEAGRHGKRAESWEVEEELVAGGHPGRCHHRPVAGQELSVGHRYQRLRERNVDVLVGDGDQVEMSGGVLRGDLRNDAADLAAEHPSRTIRIHGHALFGDITARRT